MICPDSSTVS